VLGDIGVRSRGVRVPITWHSVALGMRHQSNPRLLNYTKGGLCDPGRGLRGEC
jgi:hypothetical protein